VKHTLRLMVLALSGVLPLGCGPGTAGVFQGIGNTGSQIAGAARAPEAKLMIFGGPDHRTYLGCLNCNRYAADSVSNQYGRNGSRYSAESIWNPYSQFGSRYSAYGTCNPYATDPPVIVDENGRFYGRLTVNIYHRELGAGAQLQNWLVQTVCRE
jgi:hypothetical protein